ncbi:hypothetical protein SASPL_134530 [Salvia splendens]|uniref:Uncharacterized protein n=1 Tax=Salvia splendens TaxID=180675 RepID=A0A8X8X530_SALSN|nr:hypothetical protein SASPL_134530 [Salvia splendens]
MVFGFLYKFFYPSAFKDEIESNQAFKDEIESNQQPCMKKQKKEGLGFRADRINVVSTSLLSSRWMDLWKHTAYLEFFDTDDLYRIRSDTEHDSWDVGTCKHVKMVNSVLESHQGLFLKHFRLNFYVNKSAQSAVTKWLAFVWSRQVELGFELPV